MQESSAGNSSLKIDQLCFLISDHLISSSNENQNVALISKNLGGRKELLHASIQTDKLHLARYMSVFFFNLAKSVHSKNLKISFFVLKRSILTLTDYISRQRQVLWHFGILRHWEERIWILYSKIP